MKSSWWPTTETGRVTAPRDWCHWQRKAQVPIPLVSMITDLEQLSAPGCASVQNTRKDKYVTPYYLYSLYLHIHNLRNFKCFNMIKLHYFVQYIYNTYSLKQ